MDNVYLYHRNVGPISLEETYKPTFPISYALREWGGQPPADAANQRAPHPHTMAAVERWIEPGLFQLVTGINGEPLPAIPHRDESGKRVPVYLGHHLNVYRFTADGDIRSAETYKATKKGFATSLIDVDVDASAALFETAEFIARSKRNEGPLYGFWRADEGPMMHRLVREKKVSGEATREAGLVCFKEIGAGARNGVVFRKFGETLPNVNGFVAQLMLLDPNFLTAPIDKMVENNYWQLLHRAYLGAWHSEALKQRRAAV
jgi:hypothetical protein